MKYTMRHVQKFMSQGKIDPVLWQDHFPHALGSKVPSCNECEDHKNNLCEGGRDPVDCFIALSVRAETIKDAGTGGSTGKKKNRIPEWTPAAGQRIPQGANKTFDQSKA